ncbi:MAG: hypothetical protein WD468_02515 [Pirellulales bacterium]
MPKSFAFTTGRLVLLIIVGLLGWTVFATSSSGEQPPKGQSSPTPVKSDGPSVNGKLLDDRKAAEAAAAALEAAYAGVRPPESVRMLAAILRGSKMGPGEGWFEASETRYTWKWLAGHSGVDPAKGGIGRANFSGPDASFSRLDRNKDGTITPDDLDWSDRNPYVQSSKMAARVFKKLNAQADDGLTKDELLKFFEKAARGKVSLSADDFRDALLAGDVAKPSEMPSTAVLVRGFFAGDLGSMHEGPKLNEAAPEFRLQAVEGSQTVQLSKLVGSKPVMLVFGSFT